MSDLQCPATILIARNGDAEHTVAGVLSDDGGWLTDLGRAQVDDLAVKLRPRRIAAVYSSRMNRAVESGERAATDLGVRSFVIDGLQELSVGDLARLRSQDPGGSPDPRAHQIFNGWLQGCLDACYPGGEDAHTVVNRFTEAVEVVADMHRGETALVFTHSSVMSLVIPRLSVNVRNDLAAQRVPPQCEPVEVEVDADGWRLVSWPGATAADVVMVLRSEQS